MRKFIVSVSALLAISTQVHAAVEEDVFCAAGHELQAAIASAAANTTLNVSGICFGPLNIVSNDLHLIGDENSDKASIQKPGFLPFPQDVINIDGAVRVSISGFHISNGLSGINATGGANFSLNRTDFSDNIVGVSLTNSNATFTDVNINGTIGGPSVLGMDMSTANLRIAGQVNISGVSAFGMNVLSNSNVTLEKDAKLNLSHNFLGAQFSVGSSLFADERSKINVEHNRLIGLSVNTGSTGMLFNSTLTTHDNGLDGLDIVSSSNFEVDGDAQIVSERNGREGISIDNSTLNMFGFFSSQPDFPNITSNNNGAAGIQVESTSKLDIGRNASIIAMDNGNAGISLDDGSSALIQRGTFSNNGGSVGDNSNIDASNISATFGSRISFANNRKIGRVYCDNTSYARGDAKCNQPK
jgi:hypothetical protein